MAQGLEIVARGRPSAAGQNAWLVRWAVWLTGISAVIPEIIGSAFNIAYNIVHVETLLSPPKLAVFFVTIAIYNLTVYPVAIAIWMWILWSLHRTYSRTLRNEPVDGAQLMRARRMVINLPRYGVGIGVVGWLLCIPVFLGALVLSPGPLDSRVYLHLPVSFLISAVIAATHGFFLLELLAQRLLYPVLFQNFQPSETPGARPLSLRARGLLWVLSAGVAPISSLLLLTLVPHDHSGTPWFALAVGGIGIAFGLATAWLVGQWVTQPVDELKVAARAVAAGDLTAHIDLLRADDFGPLIDEFNEMVSQLREKQKLHETFGRHVGRQAAQLILNRDPGLGGFEEIVTVVFVDIRGFTARCERATPQEVVTLLNYFLAEMVDIVEKHGGMVNKFLGDGLMAIFGLGSKQDEQASAAVAAGRDMLHRLANLNRRLANERHAPLEIGIGVHTGPAIVGSIGAPQRMEFTVIGDTVNVASRVEGLTKTVCRPFLITSATRDKLPPDASFERLAAQQVKGHTQQLIVYSVGVVV